SQMEEHARFGGVVPEIAARAHLSHTDHVVEAALKEAGLGWPDIDAIAATAGPGLVGGLLVGTMTGKALAAGLGKPFLAINHLEGHALTARLTHGLDFPYLLLLVSGGHTQILSVEGLGRYERLATTIDDALGEAFDKTAKLLGLGFPGGPAVEQAALDGGPSRFAFSQPLKGQKTLNFSFSGLKTAVRLEAEKLQPLTARDIADICAAFQQTVALSVTDRARKTMSLVAGRPQYAGERVFVAAGGVAANTLIRASLEAACVEQGWRFVAPPLSLCGDNAAMIAWAGLEHREAGHASALDFAVRPRWPLDEEAAIAIGAGKRGGKA
ncbi:MAG TPA: tRNA (adenosine(37)-N6)-threonylcarbamoyltransferase complex transferase subunit TsaD, partial [Rhizobiaceae bacterium]|nr:tRNA (adenosine(37)-N6)-threonylcarbamoyltransferase complex transferase subunit TsaD [Rhizobiaceae bacterium]